MLYFNTMVKEPILAFPDDLQSQRKHNLEARTSGTGTGSGTGKKWVTATGRGTGTGTGTGTGIGTENIARGWSGQDDNPKKIKVLENYHRFRENGSQELK